MSMTDISLRDHFAWLAIQGVYPESSVGNWKDADLACIAKRCYALADAMLAERESKEAVQYNWKEVGVIISNKEPTETDTVVFRNDQYLAWRWLVPSLNPMFSSCKDEP